MESRQEPTTLEKTVTVTKEFAEEVVNPNLANYKVGYFAASAIVASELVSLFGFDTTMLNLVIAATSGALAVRQHGVDNTIKGLRSFASTSNSFFKSVMNSMSPADKPAYEKDEAAPAPQSPSPIRQ